MLTAPYEPSHHTCSSCRGTLGRLVRLERLGLERLGLEGLGLERLGLGQGIVDDERHGHGSSSGEVEVAVALRGSLDGLGKAIRGVVDRCNLGKLDVLGLGPIEDNPGCRCGDGSCQTCDVKVRKVPST